MHSWRPQTRPLSSQHRIVEHRAQGCWPLARLQSRHLSAPRRHAERLAQRCWARRAPRRARPPAPPPSCPPPTHMRSALAHTSAVYIGPPPMTTLAKPSRSFQTAAAYGAALDAVSRTKLSWALHAVWSIIALFLVLTVGVIDLEQVHESIEEPCHGSSPSDHERPGCQSPTKPAAVTGSVGLRWGPNEAQRRRKSLARWRNGCFAVESLGILVKASDGREDSPNKEAVAHHQVTDLPNACALFLYIVHPRRGVKACLAPISGSARNEHHHDSRMVVKHRGRMMRPRCLTTMRPSGTERSQLLPGQRPPIGTDSGRSGTPLPTR